MAIGKGNIPRIKKLIAMDYDINSNTNGGRNMLTWCFWYPYPNKTIWSDSPILRLTNKEVESKILQMLEILIDNGADINAVDPQGSLPIEYAVLDGQTKIVKMLIEKGSNVDLKDNRGETPLHYAARAGLYPDNSEIAKILVANGAEVNVKDKQGNIPLHCSIYSGNLAIVKALIEKGSDVNAKNNDVKTPLQIAIENNKTELIDLLRAHGAEE